MGHEEEREWQTRKTRIDMRLVAQGWQVVPFRPSVLLSAHNHHGGGGGGGNLRPAETLGHRNGLFYSCFVHVKFGIRLANSK